MFVGHIGMGLALKRAEPRLNLGAIIYFSLFLDFLLGVFVLLGVESIIVPENFARLHYLHFQFQYSHSLLGALFWSAVAAWIGMLFLCGKDWRKRGAVVIGLAVFIHFAGDIIEHPRDLLVAGSHSARLGFGENALSPQANAVFWSSNPLVLGAVCWWLDSASTSRDRGGKRAG